MKEPQKGGSPSFISKSPENDLPLIRPFDRCACGYSVMACEATKAGGLHDLRIQRKTNPTLEAFL